MDLGGDGTTWLRKKKKKGRRKGSSQLYETPRAGRKTRSGRGGGSRYASRNRKVTKSEEDAGLILRPSFTRLQAKQDYASQGMAIPPGRGCRRQLRRPSIKHQLLWFAASSADNNKHPHARNMRARSMNSTADPVPKS